MVFPKNQIHFVVFKWEKNQKVSSTLYPQSSPIRGGLLESKGEAIILQFGFLKGKIALERKGCHSQCASN